jgi:hypothetical protein
LKGRFITRVELHNANWSTDYVKLHEAMSSEGFVTTIMDDDTKESFYLPPAEYYKEGEYTKEEVLASAEPAAKKTGKNYSIVTTKSGGIIFTGLTKVTK